jgi:hypothetical protein
LFGCAHADCIQSGLDAIAPSIVLRDIAALFITDIHILQDVETEAFPNRDGLVERDAIVRYCRYKNIPVKSIVKRNLIDMANTYICPGGSMALPP